MTWHEEWKNVVNFDGKSNLHEPDGFKHYSHDLRTDRQQSWIEISMEDIWWYKLRLIIHVNMQNLYQNKRRKIYQLIRRLFNFIYRRKSRRKCYFTTKQRRYTMQRKHKNTDFDRKICNLWSKFSGTYISIFRLVLIPYFINSDWHLGCERIGEIKDRNQTENRSKCASKSQHCVRTYFYACEFNLLF